MESILLREARYLILSPSQKRSLSEQINYAEIERLVDKGLLDPYEEISKHFDRVCIPTEEQRTVKMSCHKKSLKSETPAQTRQITKADMDEMSKKGINPYEEMGKIIKRMSTLTETQSKARMTCSYKNL